LRPSVPKTPWFGPVPPATWMGMEKKSAALLRLRQSSPDDLARAVERCGLAIWSGRSTPFEPAPVC
jgi:hypothetical protein